MTATWASVLGWRLERQYLEDARADSVEAVVDRLAAVPSWLGDARTSIRLRLADPGHDEVAAAVAEGRVFVTYAFRGSMHLMMPSSAAAHLTIRGAGRQWELPSWRRFYGIEPEGWPRLRATVRDALRDGPLTQLQLAAVVTKDPAYRHLHDAFVDPSNTFIKPFAWQGDLCFSPSEGAARFRLLDSVPGWAGLEPLDEAGPHAIQAYLGAYGPATIDRIDAWLGKGLSAGKQRTARWIERMDDRLATIPVEGDAALCLAEHADAVADAAESDRIVLLPGFDQWVVGVGTSDTRVVPPARRQEATRGADLVLIGGRVSGTWRILGDAVRFQWFEGVRPGPRRQLVAAIERLSAATGRDLHPDTTDDG